MLFIHIIPSCRTLRSRHIIPFRRFLEGIFELDLRSFFAESCFEVLSHDSLLIINVFSFSDAVHTW